MRQARGASGVVLRNLWDPVRNLADAVRDMTANLEAEFDAPHTSTLRRAEIIERLAAVRSLLVPAPVPSRHSQPNLKMGSVETGRVVYLSSFRRGDAR